MKKFLVFCLFLSTYGCGVQPTDNESKAPSESDPVDTETEKPVVWTTVNEQEVNQLNADLEPGKLTADLGVYIPSNLDPGFENVTIPKLLASIRATKEIYRQADVQINLLWLKTGAVHPGFLSIAANEAPERPRSRHVNAYRDMQRQPSVLTETARAAFESIVEPDPDNHRTIYLVVLEDVFMSFYEKTETKVHLLKSIPTNGLSFPPYLYGSSMPHRLRGVFTVTNLDGPGYGRRLIAHEIGHKIMNVSHEYRDISPAHEVYAEGGLMVYGSGEEIAAGAAGRWHVERLYMAPFLYKLLENGEKEWNADFVEGGHYYDPLYGDKVVEF